MKALRVIYKYDGGNKEYGWVWEDKLEDAREIGESEGIEITVIRARNYGFAVVIPSEDGMGDIQAVYDSEESAVDYIDSKSSRINSEGWHIFPTYEIIEIGG